MTLNSTYELSTFDERGFMNTSSLTITDEKDRANRFISSLLFSRATVFHPSSRITQAMKNRLIEVANSGGTNLKMPLASVHTSAYGKSLRIDLHVDYLLQAHRDILETILAYGKTIRLEDDAIDAGTRLTWQQLFATIDDGQEPSVIEDKLDSRIDSESTVLSISMYDLVTKMNIAPTRANYDQIKNRLNQLANVQLMVNELDENGEIIDSKQLKFLEDLRFYCDRSKYKSKKVPKGDKTNHVFIIPDYRLLEAIRDFGYYLRLEQFKMAHYSKPPVRSFLKFLKTHRAKFIHKKKFEWVLDEYMKSIASGVVHSFRSELRLDILGCSKKKLSGCIETIHNDFGINIVLNEHNDFIFVCDKTLLEEEND